MLEVLILYQISNGVDCRAIKWYYFFMSFTYRIIIEPDKKGFHGYVPALKGCHTWGKTLIETKQHLNEAIGVYIESLMAHGEAVPEDFSFESFETVEIKSRSRLAAAR